LLGWLLGAQKSTGQRQAIIIGQRGASVKKRACLPLRGLCCFSAPLRPGEGTLAGLDLTQHPYQSRLHHVELVHDVLVSFGSQLAGRFLCFRGDIARSLARSDHDSLIVQPHAGFAMGIFDDAPGLCTGLGQDALALAGQFLAVALLIRQRRAHLICQPAQRAFIDQQFS